MASPSVFASTCWPGTMMPSEARLHPSSILFSFAKSLKTLALPGLLVLVFGRSGRTPVAFWPAGPDLSGAEFWGMLLLIPAAIVAVVRYLTFRLRYEGTELVIREGILFRNERHVPYARIQNLDAVRNVFHRLLGVIEVRVETGGGHTPEATISVLPVEAFEEMRRRVFAGRQEARGAAAGAVPTLSEGTTLLRLPARELLLLGFIDNRGFVLIGAVIGALWQIDLLDRIGAVMLDWMGWTDPRDAIRAGVRVTLAQVAAAAAAAMAVIVFARLVSMVWAVVRFHGFELRRIGDDLRTEYGLLTRVAATIPVHRVQTITIRQGPLQRLAGRHALSVETAGGGKKAEGGRTERPWLAPIIRTAAMPEVVRHVIPEADLATLAWHPVDPRAFRRVLSRSALLVVGASVMSSFWIREWMLAVLGGGLLLAAIAARNQVRHLHWAATGDLIAFRSGWLWKRLTAARTTKVQNVTLAESPFDRRSSMASVLVDTAGAGPASHRVRIPYLGRQVAVTLHRNIADGAGATPFRW